MTSRSDLHGVLVVDKVRGPTSHDVVSNARRALGTRAIGHSGTLDPMATGVLVLVVGEATKLVSHLTAAGKIYEATLRLGQMTDTLDADGHVVAEQPVPNLSRDVVREVAQRFVGEVEQLVPAVSAVKVQGTPLYKSARKGHAVEAPVKRVRLDTLEVLALSEGEIQLRIACSKGFYVRALARDLAQALGTVGHLTALRRIQNGAFSLTHAVDQTRLRAAAQGDELLRTEMRAALQPLDTVAKQLNHLTLSEQGIQHALHGRLIPQTDVLEEMLREAHESPVRVALDQEGRALALVEPSGSGLRVVRGFRRE